ncbi:MAG: phycobiliprotein lyase, partial [Cyanobacteria bacterium P01_E01_bin.35]
MNTIKDAKEFFQQSAGKWRSQRTTHHLPFRRAESGGSDIQVDFLDAKDPKIVANCEMHNEDPQT